MTEQENIKDGVDVPKLKPGAIVEDESLCGMRDGSVVPKAPDGSGTVEGATDVRENPSV